MKTYKGESITKKQIVNVLKTQDVTAIFRLYHRIYGEHPTHIRVMDFALAFSTSGKILRAIENSRIGHITYKEIVNDSEFRAQNAKSIAMRFFREQLRDVTSSYAKRPMMGHTHLYFCSPVYGHRDYNKIMSLPIAGNERFCETMCRLADKYFTQD